MQRLCRVEKPGARSRGEEELPDGALGTRYRFAHGLYQRVLHEDLRRPASRQQRLRRPESCWCATGARTRRRAPSRWPSTSSADATRRARPLSYARGRARRAPLRGLEAVEHYTAGLELLQKQPAAELLRLDRRTRSPRTARLLLARFDEAARDYQVDARTGSQTRLPPAAKRSSGLCNAHFFEQRPSR